jgi:hypothetical protein
MSSNLIEDTKYFHYKDKPHYVENAEYFNVKAGAVYWIVTLCYKGLNQSVLQAHKSILLTQCPYCSAGHLSLYNLVLTTHNS